MKLFCCEGIQGNDIGDVKFNSDGDGLGRYSVYQVKGAIKNRSLEPARANYIDFKIFLKIRHINRKINKIVK